jgi:hypothetical protein
VLGNQVNVQLVSGHIWIKPRPGQPLGPAGDPSASAAALSKGQGFVPLTEARQIPTGSEIDALHGSLKIVTATGQVGKTQNATIAGGVFTLTEARTGISKGVTNFTLQEGAFRGPRTYATCKAKTKKAADPATIASSRTLQLLRASAHGKFRTSGRYSSATVRGTVWTIAERCDGTLTHAIRDTVIVQDFVRHKTILLHAGQSSLALAIARKDVGNVGRGARSCRRHLPGCPASHRGARHFPVAAQRFPPTRRRWRSSPPRRARHKPTSQPSGPASVTLWCQA